jgi:hypothetical protein
MPDMFGLMSISYKEHVDVCQKVIIQIIGEGTRNAFLSWQD